MAIVDLLKTKSGTEGALIATVASFEPYLDRPIARVRSDNANEYLKKLLLRTMSQRGTVIDPTCAHTPQ